MKKCFVKLMLSLLFFSQMSYAKPMVIGVSLFSFADKFQTYLQEEIQRFDQAHDDVRFVFADANNDPARSLNDIETFIDQGVDALLVCPTDQNVIKVLGRRASKANIPLIIVNRNPKEADMKYVTGYVGSREIEGGYLQAEYVAKRFAGKTANIAILMGTVGLDASTFRTLGNEEVINKSPNLNLVSKQEAKWDRAKGIEVAENILAANKKINVIISNNDEMAIGAILASRKLGINDDDILIIGLDATPDALKYLGQGLDATVYQSAQGQGFIAAKTAYRAAKGEAVEKYQWIPFELVTPDKKAEYLAKYD